MRQIEGTNAENTKEINRLNVIIKGMQAEELKNKKRHTEELERLFEISRRKIGVAQNANTNLQKQIHQLEEKEQTLTREIERLKHTINNNDQVEQDSNLQWSQWRVNGLEGQLEKKNRQCITSRT